MRKIIGLVVVIFVVIISIGALSYHQQPTSDQVDRQTLVELALNDQVKMMLTGNRLSGNNSSTKDGLILLSTPNLGGVSIPEFVQGLSLRVLSQSEIDALSSVKGVNYMFFENVNTDPIMAEVKLTLMWGYRVGGVSFLGDSSSVTYYYIKVSGQWTIDHGDVCVP